MTAELIHPSSCACCGDLLRGAFSRRHFIVGAAAFGAVRHQFERREPLNLYGARARRVRWLVDELQKELKELQKTDREVG